MKFIYNQNFNFLYNQFNWRKFKIKIINVYLKISKNLIINNLNNLLIFFKFTVYINSLKKKKIKLKKINFLKKNLFFKKKNWIYLIYFNISIKFFFFNLISIFNIKLLLQTFLLNFKYFINDGVLFLRGLLIIFFIDTLLIDDEPIWEPIEWSLIQTWIFYIFIFAWIGENLISSRFGSYTGRDKRIWFAWYKTFWLIELWFLITYGVAILFIIVPFYYEVTYQLSYIISWWYWYNRIFLFKFIWFFFLIILILYIIQLNLQWLNWKKLFLLVFLIQLFLAYLLYMQFLITFFAYFTDSTWYQKSRFVDFIQLSHEPLKWGWGVKNRDHFSYHKSTTVFWFKNDGPFVSSFFLIQFFLFLSLFFVYFFWLILLRKIYTTKEITYTYTIYSISAIKQFFYFFFFYFLFSLLSIFIIYWRFPTEFFWLFNNNSLIWNILIWIKNYFNLII